MNVRERMKRVGDNATAVFEQRIETEQKGSKRLLHAIFHGTPEQHLKRAISFDLAVGGMKRFKATTGASDDDNKGGRLLADGLEMLFFLADVFVDAPVQLACAGVKAAIRGAQRR